MVVPSTPAHAPPPVLSAGPALGRVVVREEFDEDQRALITRVIGLPPDRLGALGKRWRGVLGHEVMIEGRDLLLMAGECERVASLLRDAGASEVVVVRRPAPAATVAATSASLAQAGEPGGTQRAQIRRGLRVAIVLKADQESGALTEGVVQDILTSSPNHPRGIKVRLESGQVGRVRRILAR